jgi:iron complex outermembrane receptor protein
MRVLTRWETAGLALLLMSGSPLPAQKPATDPSSLVDSSLEDLMNLEVTSVAKKAEKMSKTAAAIFVISQEDIHNSGATNIPDLLRMVPGVDVAQIDANTWAISIRGFNDRIADKVLVLIDGRTVYTPTTSGVYWDQLDVPLEDIDRIEIIRGPGGTVWGANAMNGVIDILTKDAHNTLGTLLTAGGGSQGSAQALAQYGGSAGQSGAWRVFGDDSNHGNLTASDGKSAAADGWHLAHGGFRSDWKLSDADSLTVQGDFIQTGEGQTINVVIASQLPLQRTFNDAVSADSGNILARWKHKLKSGGDTALQIYFDRYNRVDEGVHEALNTLDLDFQNHVKLGARHDIVWGAGFRLTSDNHTSGYAKTYIPSARTNNLFSTFFQDEIALMDSLWLTVGSKFEHNAYTGFEYQPDAKLLWQPAARQAVWVSIARAVAQVSREDVNLRIDVATYPTPGANFTLVQVNGRPITQSQQVIDLEAGYRLQLNKQISVDLAAFSSYYRNLTVGVPGDAFTDLDSGTPHIVIPINTMNVARARTYGEEIFGTWTPTPRWKLTPAISAIHLVTSDTQGGTSLPELADNTPRFQAQIRSSLILTKNLDWNVAAWHTSRLRDGGDGAVPAWNRLDSRLAWRVTKPLELSVTGQNLLTPRHAEFHNDLDVQRTLVERSVFGKVTWRF